MKLTTALGLVCPHCHHQATASTRGLLGGILKQIWIHLKFREGMRRGGQMRCPVCRRMIYVPPGGKRKFNVSVRPRKGLKGERSSAAGLMGQAGGNGNGQA